MPDGSMAWPQVGDTVYVAEYGHGAREAEVLESVDDRHRVLFDTGIPRRVFKVYRTAAEAEEASR